MKKSSGDMRIIAMNGWGIYPRRTWEFTKEDVGICEDSLKRYPPRSHVLEG